MSMEVLEAIERLEEINKSIKSIEGVVFNKDYFENTSFEQLTELMKVGYILSGFKIKQERKIKRLRKKYAADRRCFYLEVVFDDNALTELVGDSLRWLYKYIEASGDITENYNKRDYKNHIHQTFRKLSKTGVLKDIMIRQSVLNYLSNDLEHSIEAVGKETVMPPIYILATESNFLGMELKFHYGNRFAKEWRNGEHVYLNLDTGETKVF